MLDWFKKIASSAKRAPSSANAKVAVIDSSPHAELTQQCIALKNNGDAYFDQGKIEDAATCYRQAIACNPDYAEAHNNLSNAYRVQNLFADAEHHLRQAIRVKPEFANFYYNLASLLMAQGNLNDAIGNFRKALTYRPDHHAARAIMLRLLQKTCRWEDIDSDITALRRSVSSAVESAENVFSPFIFITLPCTTPDEQKLCAEKWVRFEYQTLVALRNNLAFDHKRPRNDKIGIGYLSADFREHPVARLMAEVFELHNRDRFRVTAYSYGPDDGSEIRKRLQNTFDQWIDIRGHSDVDTARRIYADNIDILVDLTGFTENSRSGILALRPAPLQLNYLGYLGTMGADFVDYLIADEFIIPPEHRKHYTEKIVYLPNCFQPNDRTRPQPPAPHRESCGLPDRGFIFCCFNQTYKITSEVFDIWCRLLVAVPGSVLWLLASTPHSEENLKREATNRGVNPKRLVMAPMVKSELYLARLQCADLFLDTFPYNAGTVCSDALWMGVPVVTRVGETFSSRMAGSLLSAMEVPELISYNPEDYYQLALDLATNRKRLDAIRGKIIANCNSAPLFDSVRFTRDLEGIYSTIMSNSQAVVPDATAD